MQAGEAAFGFWHSAVGRRNRSGGEGVGIGVGRDISGMSAEIKARPIVGRIDRGRLCIDARRNIRGDRTVSHIRTAPSITKSLFVIRPTLRHFPRADSPAILTTITIVGGDRRDTIRKTPRK